MIRVRLKQNQVVLVCMFIIAFVILTVAFVNPAAGVLNYLTLFGMYRFHVLLAVLYILWYVSYGYVFYRMLNTRQEQIADSWRVSIKVLGMIISLFSLVVIPLESCDIYTYYKYGRLFLFTNSDIFSKTLKQVVDSQPAENVDSIITGVAWNTKYLYGPIVLGFYSALSWLPINIYLPLVRLFILFILFSTLTLIERFYLHKSYVVSDRLFLILLNPLLVTQYIVDAHSDAIMMFFVILTYWAYFAAEKRVLASIFLLFSILTKVSAVLFVWWVGLLLLRDMVSKKMSRGELLTSLLCFIISAGWLIWDTKKVMDEYSRFIWNSLFSFLHYLTTLKVLNLKTFGYLFVILRVLWVAGSLVIVLYFVHRLFSGKGNYKREKEDLLTAGVLAVVIVQMLYYTIAANFVAPWYVAGVFLLTLLLSSRRYVFCQMSVYTAGAVASVMDFSPFSQWIAGTVVFIICFIALLCIMFNVFETGFKN